MVHNVKIFPQYFKDVLVGIRKFEFLKNDMDYKVGDIVILNEYEQGSSYTGARVALKLCYVLKDCSECSLNSNYCIFCWDKLENLVNLPHGWYWTNETDGSGSLHKADGSAFASYDVVTGEVWFVNYDNGVRCHDYHFEIFSVLEAMSIVERQIPDIKESTKKCINMDLF